MIKSTLHSVHSIHFLCILALGLAVVTGCGDDEVEPKSFLNSYRVLALRAEPAQLSLSGPSQLSLYDFHPNDLKGERPNIEYSWRICPFSLGSLTRYECFVDEIPLPEDALSSNQMDIEETDDSNTDPTINWPSSSSVTLDPLALFAAFGDDIQSQMEQLEMGSGMLGSEMNFFDAGVFEIYVKLTVKIEGEPDFEAVKTMTVLLDSELEVNQHPEITQVSTSIELDGSATLKPEDELELEIEVSSDAVEEYKAAQSASDKEQGIEAETISENVFVYYYTTSGRFDSAVKLIDDNLATLTLGEESGAQKVFVVLRDGRGGVDLRAFDFKIKE